jgi:hypothetical protein
VKPFRVVNYIDASSQSVLSFSKPPTLCSIEDAPTMRDFAVKQQIAKWIICGLSVEGVWNAVLIIDQLPSHSLSRPVAPKADHLKFMSGVETFNCVPKSLFRVLVGHWR